MSNEPGTSGSRLFIAGCLLTALCLVCVVVVGALGVYFYEHERISLPQAQATATAPVVAETSPTGTPTTAASPTVVTEAPPANPLFGGALPTALARGSSPARPAPPANVPASIVQAPVSEAGLQQLEELLLADYPVHDFYEASQRLGRLDVGPRTVSSPAYQVGDHQTFYVDDGQADATLLAVTDHAYYWVEDSLNLEPAAVEATAQRFEEEYYPRLVHIFGQEWQPGVDNDPHFSVLHLDYMDTNGDELGHFNSGDEYPRSFFSGSNQQELIYLNMDNLTLGSELYFGTLVHEFQHLVQWYVDGNETAWMNEGLSQLAEIYAGLETAESVDYLLAPDTQLNSWSYTGDEIYAHYAASYLFCVYFWEQLGEAAAQELARHPANGIAAVDAVLKGFRPDLSLEEFMGDWVAANYLDDSAAGPQFAYESIDLRRPVTVASIDYAPQELVETLDQFGAHYIDLDLEGNTTIAFAGDTATRFLPTMAYSGEQVWFAPAQDTINAQLTRRFDLTNLDRATLTFQAWYDLKYDLDYGYVSVSLDDGQTWELLDLSNGGAGDYGSALNGSSESRPGAEKGGWVQESVALDAYAGRSILVRFELLTYYDSDARGLALDDIAVPELDYLDDAESDGGGWQSSGFVRLGSQLPQ
ncbi:MAG TPA: hypothetical protein VE553_06750, partial [Candidatus Binatia bacterium]|nr:hypothetical protein [Candidatus Binatia bacterium]